MKNQVEPAQLGQVRFLNVFKKFFLSILNSLILTIIYAFIGEKYKDNFTFAVTTLAASAIFIIAFYEYKSIKQSAESQELYRKQEADAQVIDRTLSYVRRWNELDLLSFRRVATEVHDLINQQPTDTQEKFLIDYLESNSNQTQDITNLLNFLEEMSICVEEKIVREDLLVKFYRGIVITFCKTFYVYIEHRRQKQQNDKIYRYLTNLCEKWNAR
jgi:hypothetical protein